MFSSVYKSKKVLLLNLERFDIRSSLFLRFRELGVALRDLEVGVALRDLALGVALRDMGGYSGTSLTTVDALWGPRSEIGVDDLISR